MFLYKNFSINGAFPDVQVASSKDTDVSTSEKQTFEPSADSIYRQ